MHRSTGLVVAVVVELYNCFFTMNDKVVAVQTFQSCNIGGIDDQLRSFIHDDGEPAAQDEFASVEDVKFCAGFEVYR